jgi:hypothetical protein
MSWQNGGLAAMTMGGLLSSPTAESIVRTAKNGLLKSWHRKGQWPWTIVRACVRAVCVCVVLEVGHNKGNVARCQVIGGKEGEAGKDLYAGGGERRR